MRPSNITPVSIAFRTSALNTSACDLSLLLSRSCWSCRVVFFLLQSHKRAGTQQMEAMHASLLVSRIASVATALHVASSSGLVPACVAMCGAHSRSWPRVAHFL